MSSLPRPNRNAVHTRAIGRPPEVSSDTNAPQNPGPTNWPCQQEFSRSHLNEVAMQRKTNAFRASWTVFRFAESRCPKYFHRAGWSSLVARQAHNLKVAGSNPAPATNLSLFAPVAVYLRITTERASDSEWLSGATKQLTKHWLRKNQRKSRCRSSAAQFTALGAANR